MTGLNPLEYKYSRPDVSNIGYDRLKADMATAGVPLYRGIAREQISGTGRIYVVVGAGTSGWDRSTYHRGDRHDVLVVNIYADHSRDDNGNKTKDDALNRALAVFDYVDPMLDGHTSHTWAEVYSCRRDGEPQQISVPDGYGAVLLHTRYEIAWSGQR